MENLQSIPSRTLRWQQYVYASLRKHYGELSPYSPEIEERISALGAYGLLPTQRKNELKALREALGVARLGRESGEEEFSDSWLSEKGFSRVMMALVFLHQLPMREERGVIRVNLEDYNALEEGMNLEEPWAEKFRIAGVEPDKVHIEHGTFVLPVESARKVKVFMEGNFAFAAPSQEPIAKDKQVVDEQLLRWERAAAILPQAVEQFRRYFLFYYQDLYRMHKDVVEHVVQSDRTLLEEGIIKDTNFNQAKAESHDLALLDITRDYCQRRFQYALPMNEARKETEGVKQRSVLKEKFQDILRSHLYLDRLEFQKHEMIVGEPMRFWKERVLSIPIQEIDALREKTGSPNTVDFFINAGIPKEKQGVDTFTGPEDNVNGLRGRLVVRSSYMQDYLKKMGATVTPAPELSQLSYELFAMRNSKLHAAGKGPDNKRELVPASLDFEEWKAKVLRKREKEQQKREKGV